MTVQPYRKQQPLPPSPPASPPAKHAIPSSSPPTLTGSLQLRRLSELQQASQLPKGFRKKKCKRRKGSCPVTCTDGHDEEFIEGPTSQPPSASQEMKAETSSNTVVTTDTHTVHSLTPPCDLDLSDLCLDTPPSAAICRMIRNLLIQDLLAAGRAVCPCRDINILVPSFPVASTGARCKGKGKARRALDETCSGECSSSVTCSRPSPTTAITPKDIYLAGFQKRNLLGLCDDAQVPRLGEAHGTCPIGKCGIKRCSIWDALVGGDVCDGEHLR
ncbi:hypothetical protein QFC21_005512 [Naganishia friedmannii]|uniref:Uncharacterized protein n=1 Tax=Naganishia friedmannii TaxID=89922 RepID=A0ACC2V9Q7_9TREE|nr:hypothetical protein QFC21_005512 [Naganishia friedmannii]